MLRDDVRILGDPRDASDVLIRALAWWLYEEASAPIPGDAGHDDGAVTRPAVESHDTAA